MNKRKHLLLFLLGSSLFFPLAVNAGSAPAPEVTEYFSKVRTQTNMALDVPTFPKEKETFIDYVLDTHGFVQSPKIQVSCGDQSLDLACLEAVSLVRPAMQKQFFTEENRAGIHFRENSVKAVPYSETKQSIASKYFWIHEIPVLASFYYPESFSEAELKSGENVLALFSRDGTQKSFDQSRKRLMTYVEQWKVFFVEHQSASKEEVRRFAQKVKKDIEK